MNRTDAFRLLNEYVKDPGLVRHMLAVEAAMRAYARKLGEDEEKWGIVGLLHDFDYERWPNPPDHPLKGAEILRGHGYPDDVIYAIKSHADYLTDCPRVSRSTRPSTPATNWPASSPPPRCVRPERHQRHDGRQRQEEDEVERLRRAPSTATTSPAAPPTSASI